MTQMAWPVDPMTVVQGFEKKHGKPEAGALIIWAAWSVEALFYLDDLDAQADARTASAIGHSSAVVDIAHVRWATGTAITALDLCAAALGRIYCAWEGACELDLRDFDQATKGAAKLRGHLPNPALAWAEGAISDPRYKNIHGARNPMTHSRLRRHLSVGDSNVSSRTHFMVTTGMPALSARKLVTDSKDLASQHVARFLHLIDAA